MSGNGKPTVVVHAGTGKAGSSTIQDTLVQWSEELEKRRVLVPTRNGRALSHSVLHAIFRGGMEDRAELDAFQAVKDRARDYDYLVLSSEHLALDPACAEGVRRALADLSDDIRVVMYLREPAAYYLSVMQQRLKATDAMEDPVDWRIGYRHAVTTWREAYGDNLRIVPFQSSAFPDGLVANFLKGAVDGDTSGLDALRETRSNTSEVAEVTHVIQRYFAVCHPGERRAFRHEANRFRNTMQIVAAERSLGSKAVLRDEVRDIVLRNHADELAWLRQEEGIAFDALDYDALSRLPDVGERRSYEAFRDIAPVDEAAAEEIVMHACRRLSLNLLKARAAKD